MACVEQMPRARGYVFTMSPSLDAKFGNAAPHAVLAVASIAQHLTPER
jgi:hypothetical protein